MGTGSCLPGASSAETGCPPFTNNASILDKQKAVLAGKITVGAGKSEVLNAAVAAMKGDGKKKKAKFDKDYVLRFNALYFSPLTDAMVAYPERDANAAKAAGGAGIPKFLQKTSAPASDSALYQYVTAAQEAQSKLVIAAKAESSDDVVAAGAAIKAAADGLLSAANPPIVWN